MPSSDARPSSIAPLLGALLLVAAFAQGCSPAEPLAPVKGKVIFNGKPLKFGVVMFHPPRGQVAQAAIRPDGTFELATVDVGDGVALSAYVVSVVCYEGHDPSRAASVGPSGDGISLGRSLIPLKYTRARSSGLSAEVSADDHPEIIRELGGPAP